MSYYVSYLVILAITSYQKQFLQDKNLSSYNVL